MTRHITKSLIAVLAVWSLIVAVPSSAADSVVVAGPGGQLAGYVTRAQVASKSATLTFLNLDFLTHDVVAYNAYGPDTQEWCSGFPVGRCPLFWSPLIGFNQTTPVLGLANATAGKTYTFYCTIHPGMRGTLAVVE